MQEFATGIFPNLKMTTENSIHLHAYVSMYTRLCILMYVCVVFIFCNDPNLRAWINGILIPKVLCMYVRIRVMRVYMYDICTYIHTYAGVPTYTHWEQRQMVNLLWSKGALMRSQYCHGTVIKYRGTHRKSVYTYVFACMRTHVYMHACVNVKEYKTAVVKYRDKRANESTHVHKHIHTAYKYRLFLTWTNSVCLNGTDVQRTWSVVS